VQKRIEGDRVAGVKARFPFKRTQRTQRPCVRKSTQQTQAKKNKSTQAQVTQLTQAVLVQEKATTESILFFTQRKRLRCVRLNGNRA